MSKTAYVIDSRYQAHSASPNHPEGPSRIEALLELVADYRRDGLVKIEPRFATRAELLANHARELVDEVEATAGKDLCVFDADTQANASTFETARLATGGLLAVLDAIMEGKADNGFALVRPPGHHAEVDRVTGFCFFNNIAIGAKYLQNKYGLERILIIDWDVHHGNGTQRSFYASGDVMYVSTHQYPHYPGTGAAGDVGAADGMGYTVNLPFPPGYGDAEYAEVFGRIVEPIGRQFKPDFVLISAGFDCHRLDPLGDMRVTAEGFARMTKGLLSVAGECCAGRCAAVLEGGYSLEGLKEGVKSVLDEMGETNQPQPPSGNSIAAPLIAAVTTIQKRFWTL
jgi:acetoin utilization deacetylase AcuC-like enzyme